MAADVIVNLDVQDRAAFERYRAEAPAVGGQRGGRGFVRGGEVPSLESGPGLKRLVVLEFPSSEAAWRYHGSPGYVPLLRSREECAASAIRLVEGWAPPT